MAKVNLNILIDAELKARIKALAEQENRTLSNLVETELKRVAATGQSAQTESKTGADSTFITAGRAALGSSAAP